MLGEPHQRRWRYDIYEPWSNGLVGGDLKNPAWYSVSGSNNNNNNTDTSWTFQQ